MEKETVISVKNIGKRYNIMHQQGGYIALRDVLANVLKSPLTFIKQKTQAVVGINTKEEFWALRNIDFEVKKGEVIGVIGRNGAGKSTLLKILSQITPPTEGEIKINGRVGSLLEVGTGFHPELSGRENIFLNGAILGMTRREIASKFDEIVAFAGIEQFLDTPVKRYSSGMYVRLAFSVAAHMEPDILIIDEVLAVGDVEFQKKCLGKMDEITRKEGRTIIFVSHNMQAIAQLCYKTILLKDGKIESVGNTEKILKQYASEFFRGEDNEIVLEKKSNTDATFTKIAIKDDRGITGNSLEFSKDFSVIVNVDVIQTINSADITVALKNSKGFIVVFCSLSDSYENKTQKLVPGSYSFSIRFAGGFLLPDNYSVRISVSSNEPTTVDKDIREDAIGFKIYDTVGKKSNNRQYGVVAIPNNWNELKQ